MATSAARQKSCAERIDAEYKDEIETLRKLWEAQCRGEEEDEELGSLFDHGLGFDYVAADTFPDQEQGWFRYQISWGGPSDEFRFFCDAECKPYRIEYWFLDWFDGAKVILDGADEQLLLEIFDGFDQMGMVQAELEKAREE